MSTAECYAMVRGSTLRVTGLRQDGALPSSGPIRSVVSRSVVKITLDEVSDSASGQVLRDDTDRPRVQLDEINDELGYMAGIKFLRVDPGALSLMTDVGLYINASGNVVGFDGQTRLPVTSFGLEVWSKLSGPVCADGQKWGYTLFPFLSGGYLSGFAFSNALISFSVKDARTRPGARWNVGPYDLSDEFERLLLPVSGNDSWISQVTAVPPPEQTDGIVEFEDVLDNGTAPNPMPYPLAPVILGGGGAVGVGPDWIVDGGGA